MKAFDRNSVALEVDRRRLRQAAGKAFLDGKFQWRAHIGFFVDYTVAVAKKDKAGQNEAVANLKRYTVEHGKLLGGATGLPPKAVQADLLIHVLELKGQLDAYANKQYAKAAGLYQDAYAHMFMTGSARRRNREAEEPSQVALLQIAKVGTARPTLGDPGSTAGYRGSRAAVRSSRRRHRPLGPDGRRRRARRR